MHRPLLAQEMAQGPVPVLEREPERVQVLVLVPVQLSLRLVVQCRLIVPRLTATIVTEHRIRRRGSTVMGKEPPVWLWIPTEWSFATAGVWLCSTTTKTGKNGWHSSVLGIVSRLTHDAYAGFTCPRHSLAPLNSPTWRSQSCL